MRALCVLVGVVPSGLTAPAFACSMDQKTVVRVAAANRIMLPFEWREPGNGRLIRFDAPDGSLSLAIVDEGDDREAIWGNVAHLADHAQDPRPPRGASVRSD